MAIAVTQDNFSSAVLQSSKPVVLDVFASWCGPCQQMEPIFEELEKAYADKCTFAKLNVDEAREVSIELGVSSVPTFIFMKDGKEVNRITGSMSKEALEEKIKALIG